MSGIKSLHDLYKSKSSGFIEKLLCSDITIDDDIHGSYFSAKMRPDFTWAYFKKNEDITHIDRTVSKFYEQAITHMDSLPMEKKVNTPQNLMFVMKYTTTAQDPDSIISKQILRLTHVIDTNTNTIINDTRTLNMWAEHLVVGEPQVIFSGKLSDEQKSGVLSFVYTNQDELSKKFKSESFTEYIVNLLNPSYKTNGIDSIVFRFTDADSENRVLAKFMDPLFYDASVANAPDTDKDKTNDMVYIIVTQLINFIESYPVKELSSISDPNLSFEKNYIRVMNKVFVDYINLNHHDVSDLGILAPEHVMSKEFDLNMAMIDDKDVLSLVQMNDNFKEVYKILLNFFRKKRRKTVGMFSETMLKLFNGLVDKLQNIIIGKNIFEKYTPSFMEYNGMLSEDFNINFMRETPMGIKYGMHSKRVPVNIIVDYFQPINNTHISTSETLLNKNKLKTLLVLIDNQHASEHRPFPTQVAEELIKKHMSKGNSTIIGYRTVKKNNIDSILKEICTDYIPVLWASSKSRINEHNLQIEYARKRNTKYNVSKRFKLIAQPEMDSNRVIDYILSGNYHEFCNSVPKTIHSEFYELKKLCTSNK